jgi:carbonic anhydrase
MHIAFVACVWFSEFPFTGSSPSQQLNRRQAEGKTFRRPLDPSRLERSGPSASVRYLARLAVGGHALPDWRSRLDRLCELNVIRQVRNVASDVFVQDAWARGRDLCVHGWIYSLANGLVTDLDVMVSRPEDIER